ncbi:MAG: hypothetical protein H6562_00220 [Lewinellaceae bacterium]|nr:hypothetical protein [Lewinella sp.]MCB9277309.1 hypothetical protein [Lewinellaceae bacterium]
MEKIKSGISNGYHWIELNIETITIEWIIWNFPEFFLKKSIFTHAFSPSDNDLLRGKSFLLKLKNTSKIPKPRRGEYFLYEDSIIRTALRSNQAFIESQGSLSSSPEENPAVEIFWQNVQGTAPSIYIGFDEKIYFASIDPKYVEILENIKYGGYGGRTWD